MSVLSGCRNRNFLERLSKMSKRDMFCRACLCSVVKDCELSYNIFETDDFAEKFIRCSNQQSLAWDDYPHSVCDKCYAKVLDFHQFQNMCRDSIEKFNVMMENGAEVKCEVGEEQIGDNIILNSLVEFKNVQSILSPHRHQQLLTEDNSVAEDKETKFDSESDTYSLDPLAESTTDLKENLRCKEMKMKRSKRQRKAGSRQKVDIEIKAEKIGIKAERIHFDGERFKCDTLKSKSKQVKAKKSQEQKSTTVEDDEPDTYQDSSEDEELLSDEFTTPDVKDEKTLSKVSLKCDICPQVFRFPHRLKAHQRRHQGLPGYPCTFENCERAYNRLDDLRNHLNDHNGIPNVYKCNIDNCHMVYKCFSGLNKHKRKCHNLGKELKKYTCETCGKVLTNPRSLTGHRFIHLDKSQWPFVCDEKGCTRRFRLMSQFKIHKKRHAGIKNYVCPHCGVRKTTCTELKIHINFHTFEQKFPCEYCAKVFKSVGVMRTHVNRVHEGKKPTNEIYSCSYCDRTFTVLQSKKFHEMTHTGEKPYVCQDCGKTFTYPSGLKSHKNTHQKGENRYACQECDRRFKWPSALKTHMKLHLDGAKPYACEICGKGFRWPGSYYKHKKLHLGNMEGNVVDGEEGGDTKEDTVDQAKATLEILECTTISLEAYKSINPTE